MTVLTDSFGRVHDYLRIAITDRCNMHCIYCNPADHSYEQIEREEILSYEELFRLVEIFTRKLGFKKIRLTGGEPLLRKGIFDFLDRLGELKKSTSFELGITTNGTYLRQHLERLKSSGVDRLNISLDSLNESTFNSITTIRSMKEVLSSALQAEEIGFPSVKLNVVIIKNINDAELPAFVELTRHRRLTIQFIEFMPFKGNSWVVDGLLPAASMVEALKPHYELIPVLTAGLDKTGYYTIPGHQGKVRFISSLSDHFCVSCNRLRISADGRLRLCLFESNKKNLNIKNMMRARLSDEEIINALRDELNFKWKEHPPVSELGHGDDTDKMINIGG